MALTQEEKMKAVEALKASGIKLTKEQYKEFAELADELELIVTNTKSDFS